MAETTLIGKTSWFGGPHDSTDSGHTANGETTKTPGIAVYNHKTLGGYWRVTTPNGKSSVLKQTDIGPAPWTGRKVDVTYSALGQLGYNEGNFPTDSQVHAEYLGRSPVGGTNASSVPHGGGALPSTTGKEATSFDKAGYEQAAQHAAGVRNVAGLFSGSGAGDVALRSALEKAGAPPSEAKFTAVKTPSGVTVGAPHTTTAELAQKETATQYAQKSIGKYAENQGSNLGSELNTLESQFGMKGEPWCAIFATTVASHGGAGPAVKTASVAQINQWASEGSHGYQRGLRPSNQAKPGDLLTFGSQHVAVVKEVRGGKIYTIEGNANGSGGVVALSHNVGEGQIARPKYGA